MTTTRAAIEQALADDFRMNAYYFGFNYTGMAPIDKILSAVASAGKAYLSTSDWNDENQNYGHSGETPVDWIQNAADEAMVAVKALIADHDAEKKALEDELVRVRERFGKVLVAIDDAWANYERMGEVCPFEGQPMIYAATLEEIHNVAIDAALSPTTTNKKEL